MKAKTIEGKPKVRLTLSASEATALYESIVPSEAEDAAKARQVENTLCNVLESAGII